MVALREIARPTLRSSSASRRIPGRYPRRGDGDAPAADGGAPGPLDQPQGGGDGVVVQQGFPHAHHDDVGDPSEAFGGSGGVHLQQLVDDLRRRQVADETHAPRGAETAVEGAAHLRGQAEGAPPAVEDEDRLELRPLPVAEDELHRHPRVRIAALQQLQAGHAGPGLGQGPAQAQGQVGHRLQAGLPASVDPGEELVAAVRGLPHLHGQVPELLRKQTLEIEGSGGPGRSHAETSGGWPGDRWLWWLDSPMTPV